MARLSALAGDYIQSGAIVDRQQIVALGGEDTFTLTFIEGSEEVYLNGSRLLKGVSLDYVTAPSTIILNDPLDEDDTLLLVGRATTADIPFERQVSESVEVTNGQTEVSFSYIETDSIEVYVSGPLVDRGRLSSPTDYELKEGSLDTIVLKSTFPEGTLIEGVQGTRFSSLDADNLMINDGTSIRSLSDRFSKIKDSDTYFMQSNSTQLHDVRVGLELVKWSTDVEGIPTEDSVYGEYPVLRALGSYWDPVLDSYESPLQVVSWRAVGNVLTVTTLNNSTIVDVKYVKRNTGSSRLVLASPNGTLYRVTVNDDGSTGSQLYS